MRKVKLQDGSLAWFHEWFEYLGNSYALVELQDGRIEEIPSRLFTFLDTPDLNFTEETKEKSSNTIKFIVEENIKVGNTVIDENGVRSIANIKSGNGSCAGCYRNDTGNCDSIKCRKNGLIFKRL